jgi:hypothetical protein
VSNKGGLALSSALHLGCITPILSLERVETKFAPQKNGATIACTSHY